jgi:hypothetical protein
MKDMKLVKKTKGKMKLIAKKAPGKKKLIAKKKGTLRLVGKKKTARPKRSLLGDTERRGGSRTHAGRSSLFRPKVRTRADPVQDNAAGWKLFDLLAKQSKCSGSDIFNLGMRLLAREYPGLTKESAAALGKRLAEHEYELAS